MATVREYFAPEESTRLMAEDREAWISVVSVLLTVACIGVLGMALTVLWTVIVK